MPRKKLTVNTDEANDDRNRSFLISHKGTFVKDGVRINAQGMTVTEGQQHAEGAKKEVMTNFQELEMGEHLGHGGGGVVNKAALPSGEPVAVKTINILDQGKRHQLMRELKTLWKASSPHIVDFKGAFFDEVHVYVVLEYMDGGSLQDVLLKARKIPEPILAQVTLSIARGLEYLKTIQMVHRDVKPGNILISRAGQVKLTDFGVTGDLANAAAESSTFVGTAKYMSPEQLSGKKYGYPADVWALGICLMELATGEHPYSKYKCASQMELLLALESEALPELPGSFSREFRDFSGRCLTMEPDARATVDSLLKHPFLAKAASGGPDVSEWLNQELDMHRAKGAKAASAAKRPIPARVTTHGGSALSLPSPMLMSPLPSPQPRQGAGGKSPQAVVAREMALAGMTGQEAAAVLASAAAAANGYRGRPAAGQGAGDGGGGAARPPVPQPGGGRPPARRSPMKAARARTPENGAGFARAYGAHNPDADGGVFAEPGYHDGSLPPRPRPSPHKASPHSSPVSESPGGQYDGSSRAGGYRSRLAAWRRQNASATLEMAYGGSPTAPAAALAASPGVSAADVAAAEAWTLLKDGRGEDPRRGPAPAGPAGGPPRPSPTGNAYAAAARAHARGGSGSAQQEQLEKELARMSGQLAALESERSMAPAPQRSPAGGSPAGGGGMEQHEMLAMLEQTQPMVRRLEGAMGAARD